jgi:hypothetical protein
MPNIILCLLLLLHPFECPGAPAIRASMVPSAVFWQNASKPGCTAKCLRSVWGAGPVREGDQHPYDIRNQCTLDDQRQE